ncbi:unnamed protein product [Vitrella brassicaformis CCMP3155]|uniref:Uncharacterized protein n=1 Tax=Vitrella brassicaformis (strain CCMP3155) TaxID=1169540 RepID=A0A0G4EVD6_VITBC|nr:unnamed protein product [Vitrella brassicaformis CCMP3155]|eukprot:CEM02030.1 unnamed protein product [Vitrella brassicaformis CCMP3155]
MMADVPSLRSHLPPFNSDQTDDELEEALFAAVHGQYPMSTVPVILPHVSNLDARDEKGKSVLHHAVIAGNIELVQLLLETTREGAKGVDINGRHSVNNMSMTALHTNLITCPYAVCVAITQTLIDYGIDIDATIPIAEWVDSAWKEKPLPPPFRKRILVTNTTALHQSALDNGANLHARTNLGTPLVMAAVWHNSQYLDDIPNRVEIARMAIARGADVNDCGESGTALHWAALKQHPLRLLRQAFHKLRRVILNTPSRLTAAALSLGSWACALISWLTKQVAQPRPVDIDLDQQLLESATLNVKRTKRKQHRRAVTVRAGGGESAARARGPERHDAAATCTLVDCKGSPLGGEVGVGKARADATSEDDLLQQCQAMAAEREAALNEALAKERQSAATKSKKMSVAIERLKAQNEDLKQTLMREQKTVAALRESQNKLEGQVQMVTAVTAEKECAVKTNHGLTEKLRELEAQLTNLRREKEESVAKIKQLEGAQSAAQVGFINVSAISSYDDRLRTAVDEQAVLQLQADVNSSLSDVTNALDQMNTLSSRCQKKLVDLEDQKKCVVCTERRPCVTP